MNKKYLVYSFIFLASISLHGFADHHDHFGSTEEYTSECQACEENVFLESSSETDLISRFVRFKSKSNLSRAPPLN